VLSFPSFLSFVAMFILRFKLGNNGNRTHNGKVLELTVFRQRLSILITAKIYSHHGKCEKVYHTYKICHPTVSYCKSHVITRFDVLHVCHHKELLL
jgi:hypothetical protein